MTVVLASDRAAPDLALVLDVRALVRRALGPMLLSGVVVGAVLLFGGRAHGFIDGLRRALGVSPSWAALAAGFECVSLVGYVGLLSLVAGRATPQIGARESAQITLAGAAATRLLPTAGAGGLGLIIWTLRRAGLQTRNAIRTVLVLLVLLYSAFLSSMALAGLLLALGLMRSRGPVELSATMGGGALFVVVLGLALALRHQPGTETDRAPRQTEKGHRVKAGARLVGEAVREASGPIRSGNLRLAGAVAYWAFDAAVLWALLEHLGHLPRFRLSRLPTSRVRSPTPFRSPARSAEASPAS